MTTSSDHRPTLKGYKLTETLYQGANTEVYRALRLVDEQPVVIKLLQQEYPTFGELLHFRNQYAIAKNLQNPSIVRPLCLETYRHSYALVMEDFGGISLREYTKTHSLKLAEFLEIALQLADILHYLYQNHVIHKDIKPANILIHPETQQVKLIDFSISSLLPKETQDIKNPQVLEGTLAYLSPEQTGRMNRGIDYRSDFYSLGVTLFELLTGQLPFLSEEPMELVHCHIAKKPPPLREIKSQNSKIKSEEIPQVLADLVMKLMAKNAEDRYQSALGLKHDLEKCLQQWQETGKIADFAIGTRDVCDRFIIPEKLYGRESEVETLLAAFDRIASGRSPQPPLTRGALEDSPLIKGGGGGSHLFGSELMLVAGFSGIGKTAIVNEVHKPIVRQRGYFIKGKFDQFNRNIPFSAFVEAFRDLMGQLLSESDSQLRIWTTKILAALGENGQVIIEVIPELERIIGQQPSAPELSGTAAQNRFNLLFQKFISVFTTKEHPLVIFLDDLQWIDSASLKLMQLLVNESEIGYLLLIGAYRDNEVFPAHPLMLTLDAMTKTGATLHTMTLSPLSSSSLNQLVTDTLGCPPKLAQPLTELVYQKTKGNPFFATQFLKALHQEKLITFDGQAGHWQCDIIKVRSAALTDDVVEFMTIQLQKLSVETQEILKLAACIGHQFDLTTLAIISEGVETEVATVLWKALQEGLILPQSEIYKFYLETEQPIARSTPHTVAYRFLHDRVQQAAYSLIPEEQKQVTHLKIGQLLLSHATVTEREEKLFEIVNQLNMGKHLIVDRIEQTELTQLNLKAGQKAKIATAYAAAVEYLTVGIALLYEDAWENDYDRTLALHVEVTEAAYLNADFEQMERWATIVLEHAKTLLETVKVYETQLLAAQTQGQLKDALRIGLQVLKSLGVDFPEEPTGADIGGAFGVTQTLLAGRDPLSLLDLPAMIEPERLAAIQMMTLLIPPAYLAAPTLMPLLIFKQVELSLQYGNCALSPFSYGDYGVMLSGVMGDLDRGYEFGQLAWAVLERFQAASCKSRSGYVINFFLSHWKIPLQNLLHPLQQAYENGLTNGDPEFVGMNAHGYCYYSYFAGQELTALALEMAAYHEIVSKLKRELTLNWLKIAEQTVLNLLGRSEIPQQLTGSVYSAEQMLPVLEANRDRAGLFHFHFNQTVLYYLFGQYSQAFQQSSLVEPYLDGGLATFPLALYSFYDALIRLALYPELTEEAEKQHILDRVEMQQQKMQGWAILAPFNHQHRWELVEGERYAVLGDRKTAMDFYDRAIALAKENGYIQDEALANELAAKFYLNWGKEKVAAGYMQEAYYCYAKWGAKAKTDDLEQRYPDLLHPIWQQAAQTLNPLETLACLAVPNLSIHTSTKTSRSASTNINTSLDFATLLKASQSLSSTIQLDELLHQLTQIILQNSGGDRCALILPNSDGEWCIEAIATPETTELCSVPLEGNTNVPVKLIQYVKNTQKVVAIDNLNTDLPVIDEYLRQRQPKSLLCLPILNQGHSIGILYLKNHSTSGVFTQERILILNFLCTQAAIALENARLYQQAQAYGQQLEQSLEKLRVSETRFQKLADNVPGLIYQIRIKVDGSASMPYVSSGCQTLYEVAAEDLISGKFNLRDFEHPDDRIGVFQAVIESAQNLTPFRHEWRIITPNGTVKWVKAASQPERWEDGEIVWDGMLIDITDRKAIETEIQQKSQELEQALQDLQQAQLQIVQSEKMSTLGNLVAGVAHEINNPVGFIAGNINEAIAAVFDLTEYLELYQEKCPTSSEEVTEKAEQIDLEYLLEDLPKMLNSIQVGCDRIKGISTSLRTFSRADKDYKVPFNIHEGIDSTILILKHRLKANENRPAIEIVTEYGDLPKVECFPGQLNQVFMNILANAIDALDESNTGRKFEEILTNPNRITIQTSLTDRQVQITIADNGMGMSESVKHQIFDHLFTTKGVGKGTGLGLAIARQIVEEKHGGVIHVKSLPGEGTEFQIQIPIHSHSSI